MSKPNTRAQGHADAVAWMRAKSEQFAKDFGEVNPDTGEVEFGLLEAEEECEQYLCLAGAMERELGRLLLHRERALLPCPFCGRAPDQDLSDTLYPKKHGGWSMHCPQSSGGCGASVSGDSEAEAISAWNRRRNHD